MKKRNIIFGFAVFFSGIIIGLFVATIGYPFIKDMPASMIGFYGSIAGGALSGILTVAAGIIAWFSVEKQINREKLNSKYKRNRARKNINNRIDLCINNINEFKNSIQEQIEFAKDYKGGTHVTYDTNHIKSAANKFTTDISARTFLKDIDRYIDDIDSKTSYKIILFKVKMNQSINTIKNISKNIEDYYTTADFLVNLEKSINKTIRYGNDAKYKWGKKSDGEVISPQ